MSHDFKNILIAITQVAIGVLIVFVLTLIADAFTAPSQAPPGGNVSAPLNTSSVKQTKEGALVFPFFEDKDNTSFLVDPHANSILNSLNVAGQTLLAYGTGNVGIGTADPKADLHINPKPGQTAATIRLADSQGQGAHIRTSESLTFTVRDPRANNTRGEAEAFYFIGGNVGIGAATAPQNIFSVMQNSVTDPIADTWTVYSSRRWKENIQPFDRALEKVLRLRGVTFDWKANGKHDLGMIAEEVGKILPELVVYEENGMDAKSLDYARMTAVLVEAIKDQQQQIQDLKHEVNKLKGNL